MKQIYLVFFLALFSLVGCKHREYSNPGPSLLYVTFDGEVSNTGILPVEFRGQKYVSFGKGISDTCLDLSKNALYRKPIIIDKGSANRFNDYEGLTIMLWVKTDPDDPNEYVIIGQKSLAGNKKHKGWQISKTKTGSWRWAFSNGSDSLQYAPIHTHQPINDGSWHQLGFTVDKSQGEARFFYDGNLKAILSTEDIELMFPGTSLFVGTDPLAQNLQTQTFNGMIDDLGVWSRVLSDNQVAGLYHQTSGRKLKPLPAYKDSITILTWNIANGGTSHGKYVGVKRVADIIRESGADIAALQETLGSGELIAGQLGFYLYRRSPNLSVVSRFAPVKSFNAFRPNNFGALQVDVGNGKKVIMGPVWLSRQPNLSAYFMKDNARADTIEVREMETRGREINFVLSEIRPFIHDSQNNPVIVAGDFNSGSHLDWTERNKERYKNLVVDFPATRFMQEAGFHDAFREIYPDEVGKPGHTWSPIYKDGLQTRMDFIYYQGDNLRPSSARVINTYSHGFPSDHAAVAVSFKFESPGKKRTQSSSSKGNIHP